MCVELESAGLSVGPAPGGLHGLPLLVRPAGDRSPAGLARAVGSLGSALGERLTEHGALMFRGFDVRTAADFETVALALEPGLATEYLGTSPRDGKTKHVFSASELPPFYPIPQHCEMTFVADPPKKLFFCCTVQPRAPGGETPLCDFRRVWADLDPGVRDRFEDRGIRVIRNYGSPEASRGIRGRLDPWQLKPWNAIFGTEDRSVVEAKCAEQGFTPTWGSGGRLRLVSEHDAMRPHPTTGEPVWFNHLQVFHLSSGEAEYRRIAKMRPGLRTGLVWAALVAMTRLRRRRPADEQTMHVTYRDGAEIPDGDVEALRDTIWRNLVVIPWRRGDVLAIDNASVSHGRLPYSGPREVLVAWS